jgi:small subunit ribosomal protein S6e
MKQGIMTSNRVRLLLKQGDSHFTCRRDGYRKRKSIRGCIVSPSLAVVNLVVLKRGETDIAGLTDEASKRPARYFLKRAQKLRKLFGLTKKDDVTRYALRNVVTKTSKSGKVSKKVIAPQVQRLVTAGRVHTKIQNKKVVEKRNLATKKAAEEFNSLVAIRRKQFATQKEAAAAKKRSLSRKLSDRKMSTNQ